MSFPFIAKPSSTVMIVMYCCNLDFNGILALWWAHGETIFKLQKAIKTCADVWKINTII